MGKTEQKKVEAEIKKTGWFAVVHFGQEGKDGLPFYLRRIPYRKANGEQQTTYEHFTCNFEEAALFTYLYEAMIAKSIVDKKLESRDHPLKDHTKVMRILGEIVEEEAD